MANEFNDVLEQLEAADGACLYWKMKDPARALAAFDNGACRMMNDLLIHPQAYEENPGTFYHMETTAELSEDYDYFNAHNEFRFDWADRHSNEANMTDEQRTWVAAFTVRWEAALERERKSEL